MNAITGSVDPDSKEAWISPDDVGALGAIILQDPIEKHRDAVYEMNGDVKTFQERAEVISRVLGKEIKYARLPPQQRYDYLTTKIHMEHIKAYDLILHPWSNETKVSVGLPVLLGREPETFEGWFEKHKAAFL